MMATKILELLSRCSPKNVLLAGGTAHNRAMLHFVRAELGQGRRLYVPEEMEAP